MELRKSGAETKLSKSELIKKDSKVPLIEEGPRKDTFIEETLKILKVNEGRWEVWAKGRYFGDIYKGKSCFHAPFGISRSRSLWKVISKMMDHMVLKLKE